jgi:hypothetical protein
MIKEEMSKTISFVLGLAQEEEYSVDIQVGKLAKAIQ